MDLFSLLILIVIKVNILNLNNTLSMCFYWENLKKQIRVIGKGKFAKKMNLMNIFQLVCVGVKLVHGHQNNLVKLSVENIC